MVHSKRCVLRTINFGRLLRGCPPTHRCLAELSTYSTSLQPLCRPCRVRFRHSTPPNPTPSSASSSASSDASAEPSASPSASATRIGELTVAPTPMATPAGEQVGFLGPGYVSGLFSADGVSDGVLSSLGEEGVTRQVCTLIYFSFFCRRMIVAVACVGGGCAKRLGERTSSSLVARDAADCLLW